MANTIEPATFAIERWMRMPRIPVTLPGTTTVGWGDLFVFSGTAGFTGGPEELAGTGKPDTDPQGTWMEYNIVKMRVGPHWSRLHGVCPMVVIGGHSQVSPDVANAMGFKVQGVTDIQKVQVSTGVERIELSVNVLVRGGTDGAILSLAYQVMAWGALAPDMGNEGVFFAGASDPT